MSASLQSQGNFKIAVFIPDNQCEEGWGYISAATNHFGAYTPLITHTLQRRVVEAVLEDECSVGILPMPERQEESPWWRHLAVQGNTAKDGTASKPARIIAKIPFAEPFEEVETIKSNINPCLVIAKGEADPSGLDETYVVFDLAHNLPSSRIESRLVENDMEGIVVSIWHDNQTPERWLYLICIKEFILKDNVKLDRFAEGLGESLNQVTVLGSYAAPLSPNMLI